MQELAFVKLSMEEAMVPLSLLKVIQISGSNEFFPNTTSSRFHKDEKYWCIRFYKPVSQYSKLI